MTELEIKLSMIIDNIDTASDMARGNHAQYVKLIQKQIANFHKLVSSDGYLFKEVGKQND